MKYGRLTLPVVGLAVFMTGDVLAAGCDRTTYPNLATASDVSGKGIVAQAPDGEEWKEDHCPGGNLYKVGDGSNVDPRVLRGQWSIPLLNGSPVNGFIRYNYGPTANYVWRTFSDGAGGLCWQAIDTGQIVAKGNTVALSGPCP